VRICFIIDRLNRGGAERQLIELIKGLDREQFTVSVVVLHHGGDLQPELDTRYDLAVYTVPRREGLPCPGFLIRLYRLLKEIRPELIHGFMGGMNELCLLLGRLLGARVVWGIRNSDMKLDHYGLKSKFLFFIGAVLSKYSDLIIVNSSAGRNYYAAHGYASKRMSVIPNGIDINMFFPDQSAGEAFRRIMGVREDEILIGHIGRIDPMKDHETFLQAAAMLSLQRKDLRFLCAGDGEVRYLEKLRRLSSELGLDKSLIWTGARTDMNAVYNGLDIFTSSSSFGEGFSNVIGEAMACGKICVATDVGDSPFIVGDAGIIIPPRNPNALADAWKKTLALPREDRLAMGTKARKRIMENFTTDLLVKNTVDCLLKTMAGRT
jgi:glycosyltransferase involved in cell wall biosynthesis